MAAKPSERNWAHNRVLLWLGVLPTIAFFGVFYGIAMLRMGLYSLHVPDWSLKEFLQLAADQRLWQVLASTFGLAGWVTLIALVIGYPIALVMLHARPGIRRVLTVLLVLPLWTSTLVRSYAWMVLLGRQGVINQVLVSTGLITEPLPLLYNRAAVMVGMVHVMLPYIVFPIYSVMRQIDLRLVQAARALGAGPWTALIAVFFPLSLPGVFVGCILVFVMSLGFWVTPTLLGGLGDTTYVMVIDHELNDMVHWSTAAAMSVVLLAVTLLVLFLGRRLVGFGAGSDAGTHANRQLKLIRIVAISLATVGRLVRRIKIKAPSMRLLRSDRTWNADLSNQQLPIAWLITMVAMIFLLGPTILLFPLSLSDAAFMQFPPSGYSFRWFQRYLSGSDWLDPTFVSLKVAVVSMLIAVPVGTLTALGIVRTSPRIRPVLLGFLLSPLIVPPVIIAVAFYLEYAKFGLVGTITGLVLSHLVLSIPLVLIVVMGTMQNFDYSLDHAARSLGAGPLRTVRRIVLPLIWPGVVTATFFAFLTSFDEVVLSSFLGGASATTLPKRLLDATRAEFQPTIAAVSVLLILLSFMIVAAIDIIQRKTSSDGRAWRPG